MSVASSTIGFFRMQWERRFVDSCVVKRQTGETFDPDTGQATPTYATQYSGPCLVRPGSPSDTVAGEQQVELRTYTVLVPHHVTTPQVDDLVDVTSTRDGVLNGKTLVVRNVSSDTYNTVRRLVCEDNQGG